LKSAGLYSALLGAFNLLFIIGLSVWTRRQRGRHNGAKK